MTGSCILSGDKLIVSRRLEEISKLASDRNVCNFGLMMTSKLFITVVAVQW